MKRTLRWILTFIAVILIAGVSFSAGYQYAETPSDENLKSIEQVWALLQDNYVEPEKVDPEALAQAAIEGMLDFVGDPYTAYLDPISYQMSHSDLEGSFSGIGAYVSFDGEKEAIILMPISGSPAERAGVKPGDILLEVNGEDVTSLSVSEVVTRVRGPVGESVQLTVLHPGESEPVEISIVREKIEVPSVIFEVRDGVAIIQITEFTERTAGELEEALGELDGVLGIVLDLRYNPGGLLSSVVDVASYFLDEGDTVVSVRHPDGKTDTYKVVPKDVHTALPVVVLVNRYSASGSEVLSGALQDNGRAVIAGERTFGKGSVNVLYELENDSGVYITTARWLTPNGNLIEGEGIEPDFSLALDDEGALNWAIDYIKDISS